MTAHQQQKPTVKSDVSISRQKSKDMCKQMHEINQSTLFKQEKLKAALVNARSIKGDKKSDLMKDFLDVTDCTIVGITESWLPDKAKKDNSFNPNTPHFEWLGHEGRKNRQGGGVVWGIHKSIANKVDVVPTGLPYSDDFQVSHIKLEDMDLVLVYIIPGMPAGVHEKVFDYIKKLDNKKAVIMGDFNLPSVDFTKWKAEGSRANAILDHIGNGSAMMQLVEENTRENNILDLVFVTEPDLVEEVEVDINLGKLYDWDHHPVFVTISKTVETRVSFAVWKRSMKNADWKRFHRYLQNCEWEADEQEALDTLIRENMQNAMEDAFPLKKINVRRANKEKHLTKKTLDVIAMAKKLHKIFQACPSAKNMNNYLEINAYKRFCIRRDENRIVSETVLRDSKTFWSFVNRRKERHMGIPTLIVNGKKLEDDKSKAEALRDRFLEVHVPEVPFTGPYKPVDPNVNIMEDFTFTVEKTIKAIRGMKTNSAPGVDGISALFYKNAIEYVAAPLTKLFNMSYKNGTWPSEWLMATITALHKKASRASVLNYRPITLMLVRAKIMERSMKEDICKWFNERGLWSKSQHAFRSKRSTKTCLLEQATLVDSWLGNKATKYVALISIDSQKAFDCVSFEAIGRSLIDEGVPPQAVKWFLHGLSNRKFRVRVGNEFSSIAAPSSGIMQGSNLSPVAWILHMQKIEAVLEAVPGASEVTRLFCYADDILWAFRADVAGNEHVLQNVLDEYARVARLKSLFTHPEKSQILMIGKPSEKKFLLEGKVIPVVEEMGALGITLAKNGKNTAHFEEVYKKVRQRVFFLRRSVSSNDIITRTMVWNAMMASIIRYAYSAVKKFNLTQIMRLQSLQHLWMKNAKECNENCKHRKGAKAEIFNENLGMAVQKCPKHVGPTPVYELLLQDDAMTYYDIVAGKMDVSVKLPGFKGEDAKTRSQAKGSSIENLNNIRTSGSDSFTQRIGPLVSKLPEIVLPALRRQFELREQMSKSTKAVTSPNGGLRNIGFAAKISTMSEIPTKLIAEQKPAMSRTLYKRVVETHSLFNKPQVFTPRFWSTAESKSRFYYINKKLSYKPLLMATLIPSTPGKLRKNF